MKYLLLSLFLTLIINNAYTQSSSKSFATIAKEQTEQLKNAVGLTSEQTKQAYPILLDNATKVGAIKLKNPKGSAATNTEIKAVGDKTIGSLKSIMTTKQAIRFKLIEETFRASLKS